METESLVETLESAGPSPYQAEAYTALIELGNASAREVAAASEVPDARIYDVLRDLQSRGFVDLFERDTIHARPAEVTTVTRDLQRRAEALIDASEEIEERYREPAFGDHAISVVKQFDTVVERTVETIDDAEFYVQLSVALDELSDFRGPLSRARERDVPVQLCVHSADRDEVASADVRAVATEARYRSQRAPFLATVDRDRVGYALHVGAANEYGLLVDDPANAFVMRWYYLTSLWEPATAVPGFPADHRRYVQIRRCARDLAARVRDGSSVPVTVAGRRLDTGASCRITGSATAVRPSPPEDRPATLLDFAGKAAIVVDADDERLSVGGSDRRRRTSRPTS